MAATSAPPPTHSRRPRAPPFPTRLFLLCALALLSPPVRSLAPPLSSTPASPRRPSALAAKGFGGGGGGGFGKKADPAPQKKKAPPTNKAKNANSFQAAADANPKEAARILKLYGGDIQRGTVERIGAARAAIERSNPALGEAMQLYEQSTMFRRSVEGLTVMQVGAAGTSPPWAVAPARSGRCAVLLRTHGPARSLLHYFPCWVRRRRYRWKPGRWRSEGSAG